ncbi:MAG TPA: hypothetical protein VHO01_07495 [Jatrophihabitans sp.]|nr:hypothetical protein [Jatrophihabitans sp.]
MSRPEHPPPLRADRWPRLHAATVVLWRAPDTVQLELGTRRVLLRNVDQSQLAPLLAPAPSAAARPVEATERRRVPGALIRALQHRGFLTRRPPAPGAMDSAAPAFLTPELTALAGRFGDDAAALLARRRQLAVAVHGTTRISTTIAASLAAAGIGQVHLVGGSEASAADSCPGGLLPDDEGRRFAVAGAEATRRASPTVSTAAIDYGRPADLVVLTDPAPIDPTVREGLHLEGRAHLAAHVAGSRAVIGPLVVPGRTSCLRCAELVRREHDRDWPLLAIQLASRPRHRTHSEVALCVAAAGAAAGQALGFLDGQRVETMSGTMEWQLPDWRLRRRSWPAHPACGCGAAGARNEDGTMEW